METHLENKEGEVPAASMQPAGLASEPPVQSPKTLLWKQVITWLGIIGGAITFFGNLKELLDLADWARWLVAHWYELMHALWAWLFGLVHIRIPKLLSPGLSFSLFVAMVVIGTRMRFADQLFYTRDHQVPRRFSLTGCLGWLGWLIVLTLWPAFGWFLMLAEIIDNDSIADWIIFASLPLITFSLFSREKLQLILASALFLVFWIVLFYVPWLTMLMSDWTGLSAPPSGADRPSLYAAYFSVSLFYSVGFLSLVSFAPLRPLNVRLLFILLGVGILISLSMISKLDIHRFLSPPGSAA